MRACFALAYPRRFSRSVPAHRPSSPPAVCRRRCHISSQSLLADCSWPLQAGLLPCATSFALTRHDCLQQYVLSIAADAQRTPLQDLAPEHFAHRPARTIRVGTPRPPLCRTRAASAGQSSEPKSWRLAWPPKLACLCCSLRLSCARRGLPSSFSSPPRSLRPQLTAPCDPLLLSTAWLDF